MELKATPCEALKIKEKSLCVETEAFTPNFEKCLGDIFLIGNHILAVRVGSGQQKRDLVR